MKNTGIQHEPPSNDSVATQIVYMAMQVGDLSEEVSVRVDKRLASITFLSEPEREEFDRDSEQWPDLFHELRAHLCRIERALRLIDNTIDRTGL